MVAAPEQPETDALESARTSEEIRVQAWAEERLLDLGFPPDAALELAVGHIDWHKAQDLLSHGCSPTLAARLLLPL